MRQPRPYPQQATPPLPLPQPRPGRGYRQSYPPNQTGRQNPVARGQQLYPQQDQYEQRESPRGGAEHERPKKRRGGRGIRVVAQFVVGLIVIAAVAAAIVALYVRYYQ
jgi:hypothetical protein